MLLKKMTINQIKHRDKDIRLLQEGRDIMLEKFIADNCPYKVGDAREITGYSYNGKRMLITRISMRKGFCYGSDEWAYTYNYIYYGDVLNKDGRVGRQYTSFEEEIEEGNNE